MNPIIIFLVLSAFYLVYAIWIWRMPEKKWVDFSSNRVYVISNQETKYNPKKVRSISIAYLLVEAVCIMLMGVTIKEHPTQTIILMGGYLGAIVVYGIVVFVFCKEK